MSETAPILVLSFRHRNELSAELSGQGHNVVAMRRPETLDRHIDARVFGAIIVDARDAVVEALSTIERIAQTRPDYSARTQIILASHDMDYAEAFVLCGVEHANIIETPNGTVVSVRTASGRKSPLPHAKSASMHDTFGLTRNQRNAIFRGEATLLLCEIIDLSRLNDRYGRSSGDMLLNIIARRIDRILRTGTEVATDLIVLGGARFAILKSVPQLLEDVELFGLAIASHVATSYAIHHHIVVPHIRISGALARKGDTMATLVRRAALARSIKRVHSEQTIIASAIATGDISIVYQPQYDSIGNIMCGVEALARWRGQDGSERGAAALIGVAMSEGAENILGNHIRNAVFREMATWVGDAAALPVAINILPKELQAADFASALLAAVSRHSVSPKRIILEITEHSLIDVKPQVLDGLNTLRKAGVRIALDDFGTGFSSLAALKNLPVDILKIDAGFSRDATGSVREQAILRTIIQLARTLDLDVVAEGIESEPQLTLLRDMGISYYQGFLRSPPVPGDVIAAMISAV